MLFRFSFRRWVGILGVIGLPACQLAPTVSQPPMAPRPAAVLARFGHDLTALDSATAGLARAVARPQPVAAQRAAFLAARRAWKQVEFLAEYYAASTAKQLNGPALAEVEEYDAQQRAVPPQGLQVLETYFYPAPYPPAQRPQVLDELARLRGSVASLRHAAETIPLTDAHVFDALRLELFRVLSLGITGFDTPASPGAVAEAEVALQALGTTLALYQPALRRARPDIARALAAALTASRRYLRQHPDPATFDRLAFLADYANPLARQLWQAQQALRVPFFQEVRLLRADAVTLFDADAFAPQAFALNTTNRETLAQIDLGRQLFFDPALSGNGQRSCGSCHRPERAFTDGQARSRAFGGRGVVARNAPTLLNAGLQRGQFYDGRAAYLEDQAAAVLANATEMHGSMEAAATLLGQSPAYRRAFAGAFPTGAAGPGGAVAPVVAWRLKASLAAYVRSLTRLNAPLDRYLRGERTALDAAGRRGFNLFAGKAKCATCHFLPLFNGTVPPGFERTETEVLGVPARPVTAGQPARPDTDPGRFGASGIRLHRGAFKTPTLRNVALTAPYMHHGTFRTLEQVVTFYNEGGGAGQGLAVPNQTLPADPLHLTSAEQRDLVHFLGTLTDTSGLAQERPRRLPAFPTAFRQLNQRAVGGRY